MPLSVQSELKLFYDLARELNSSLDLDFVLAHVIEQVNHFLNIDATSVSLLDPESKELIIQMTIGAETDPEPGLRLPPYAGIAGWVVRHLEPVLIADVQKDPRFYPTVDQRTHFSSRSMICVPLIVKDKPIGVIQAISKSVNAFSHADFYFVTTLADIAALNIENARLYKTEQQARRYAEALKWIAETVILSPERERTLDLAMARLYQTISCDSIAIFVLGGCHAYQVALHSWPNGDIHLGNGLCLLPLGGYGFDDLDAVLKIRVPVSRVPLFEQLCFARRPVMLADTRLDDRYVRWSGAEHVRSWLGVPLIVQDRVIGWVSVDRCQIKPFTPGEVDFIASFAQQISNAIVNDRLYGQVRDRADDLAILNELSWAIGTCRDRDAVMNRALDTMMALFAPDAAALLSLDAENNTLVLHAERGFSDALLQSLHSLLRHGSVVWDNVVTERKTMVLEHGASGECGTPGGADRGVGVCIWVPLLVNGDVVGALVVYRSNQHRFSVQYLSLLEAIGRQIAIAIENADIHSQARRIENHFRHWAQATHAMAYGEDAQGEVLYIDLAAEALTGYSIQDLLHASPGVWSMIVHPQDLALVEQRRQWVNQERKSVSHTFRIVRRDKTVGEVCELVVAVLDEQGRVKGRLGLLFDKI